MWHEAIRSIAPPSLEWQSIARLSPNFHQFPMERETVRVKNLASEHNTMTRSVLEPRPLTTRSPAHYNHDVTTSPEKD